MKKRFFSLFLCTALLLSIIVPAHTAWADASSGDEDIYTDPNTGATFVVPEGWVLEEITDDSLQASFIPLDGSQKSIFYSSDDLWGNSTVSERSGKSRSDYNVDFLLETAPDEIVLEEGLAIPRDDLERVSYGKNEYLQFTIEAESSGVTATATYAITLENGYTYDFWFFGLSGQSTKDIELMLSSLQIPRPEETDFADGESGLVGGDIYTDPDTGATFIVPENWTEEKLLEGTDALTQICLVSLNDFKSTIQYSSYDVWDNEMITSERAGHTRSDIDSAYAYTNGMFQKMLVNTFVQQGFDVTAEDIQLVTYGKTEYIELTASQEISGISATLTISLHIENGYLYDFTFGGANDKAAMDFQSLLRSLQVPASAEAGFADGGTYTNPDTPNEQNASGLNLSMLNPLAFLINLLATFSVYTLPILIYRFALHSGPLEKKQARKTVIIYGICAYLLMCFIMALFAGRAAGVSIFFWSYVNYYILTSGKRPDPEPADTPATHTDRLPSAAPAVPASYTPAQFASQTPPAAPASSAPVSSAPAAYTPAAPVPAAPAPQTPPAAPRIQFCRKCGSRLLDDSKFCSVCGASIVPISKE